MIAGPALASLMTVAMTLGPAPAKALTLGLPKTATLNAQQDRPLGSYRLPTGPWRDGAIPVIATEGRLRIRVWRIPDRQQSTMQMLAALRARVEKAGYATLFQCATQSCGGFDFRFGTRVLSEPQMHVDLGDYRFLAARRTASGAPHYLSLMVSRSAEALFVQLIRVDPPAPGAETATEGAADAAAAKGAGGASATPPANAPPATAAAAPDAAATASAGGDPAAANGLIARLEQGGAVALDDLNFPSGASELAPGRYASLAALAAYLKQDGKRRIALVGHTDDSGSLAANIALSRKRAQSVAARLIDSYGVNSAQIDAEGVGYLAPRGSNFTKQGRMENRRVEVMLTSGG